MLHFLGVEAQNFWNMLNFHEIIKKRTIVLRKTFIINQLNPCLKRRFFQIVLARSQNPLRKASFAIARARSATIIIAMGRITTDFLYSTPTFLSGAATVFNLAGGSFEFNRSESECAADIRALRNDFQMVGQDIRDAAKIVKDQAVVEALQAKA